MSVKTDSGTAKQPGLSTELEDGRTVSVEVESSPDNEARVDVRVDSGRHWIFGVDDDTAVLLMVLNEQGNLADSEIPSWLEPLIRQIGLAGVEQ